MKRFIMGTVGWLLLWQGAVARADDVQWHPTALPSASSLSADTGPTVKVGRPVAISVGAGSSSQPSDSTISQVSWRPAQEDNTRLIVRAQAGDLPGPPPPPPPDAGLPAPGLDERYNCAQATQNPAGHKFLGGVKSIFDGTFWKKGTAGDPAGGRTAFKSDHVFDSFISPVSNPFYFIDPRSLTEIKPIVIYQSVPTKNYLVKGGDIEFFGIQGSLALTERWSIVLNKFGYLAIEPGTGAPARDSYGFTELHLGPKYTFLRNDSTGTLGAFGLTFEVPTGASGVFQDTGTLSLVPYLSMAQHFGKTTLGSFNAMGTVGYSFGLDNERSDYLFTSLHLDFNLYDLNKFYPLIELNWFHYNEGGTARNFGFEGRDLANIGSRHVGGDDDNFAVAVGARYKFSEAIQTGAAVEFPLNGRRDLLDFRLTFDVIFRY